MKAATLLLAAALALPAPAARAEEGGSTRVSPADLEEKFYRAYYAENGLRDFPKAAEAYAEVQASALSVGRKDLAVKALLGRARCMRTMGKGEEARAAFANALELDPSNGEAKAGAARDAEDDGGDADLEERMRFLVSQGLLGLGLDSRSAARELRLLGDRCLPILAEALGTRDLATVEAAAVYLASLDRREAGAILLRAMRDPEVVYRSAIARAVCHPTLGGSQGEGHSKPFSVSEVPVLAAAAEFPEAEIHQEIVSRLFYDGDPLDDAGRDLLLRLATDPDRAVRMRVLGYDFTLETARALGPALRRSLASGDREERLEAIKKARVYTVVLDSLADALRGLLRDPDAEIRAEAFAGLRPQFTEEDLVGMLDPSEPALAAGAAEMLKDRIPWSAGAAAKVGEAIGRAVRGEFGDEFTPPILDLALVFGSPLRQPSSLVDLFARTAAPDAQARPRHLAALRSNILAALRQPLRWDQSPQREQAVAIVEEGAEKCLGSGGILQQWVAFWSEARVPAPRAWLRAAASDDSRARTAAYLAILRSDPQSDPSSKPTLPPGSLPHLGRDLVSQDRETRTYALQLAERAPSPAIADSLRALHDAAETAEVKRKLLVALVAAAGRAAEDAVRKDLADPGVRNEALRLLVNELGFQDRSELDAFVQGGGDPYCVVALRGHATPASALLRGFVNDLPVEKYTYGFVPVAAHCVDGAERVALLRKALGSDGHMVRFVTVKAIGDLRVLELWPDLVGLLESGEANVRAEAEKSLAALKAYAELKSSFARFGKDEQGAALQQAKALLASSDPVKRQGAVLALAAIGDRSAIPLLLRALDDESVDVRKAALEALERLGGKTAPK